MFTEERTSRTRASLDISPLIDVVFQLVIFFAVTTTFLEAPGIELQLPESATATPETMAPIVVQISGDGDIYFRGDSVSVEELRAAVEDLPEEERERVTVEADQRVQYGTLVRVIDGLRQAGMKGLTLPMAPEAAREEGSGGAGDASRSEEARGP